MKKRRQDDLISLIHREKIKTQEELTERLAQIGYPVTQATVSRDIKELKIIKTTDENGEICYCVPRKEFNTQKSSTHFGFFKSMIHSVDTSVNIIVIHTLPGLANAAASALDAMNMSVILGTIAGDDTVFIVMRDNNSAAAFCGEIKSLLN